MIQQLQSDVETGETLSLSVQQLITWAEMVWYSLACARSERVPFWSAGQTYRGECVAGVSEPWRLTDHRTWCLAGKFLASVSGEQLLH